MADKMTRNWPDGINVILGLWLIASPWVLGFAGVQVAMLNAVIFGVVIAAMAIAAMTMFRDWEEWVDMAVGLWLIASPWVLGFAATTAAMWNVVIVGAVVLALSGWALREHRAGHLA